MSVIIKLIIKSDILPQNFNKSTKTTSQTKIKIKYENDMILLEEFAPFVRFNQYETLRNGEGAEYSTSVL